VRRASRPGKVAKHIKNTSKFMKSPQGSAGMRGHGFYAFKLRGLMSFSPRDWETSMKHRIGAMLLVALLFIPSAALPALAADSEPAFAHETPLMIIRFNQAHVNYPMPLYNTISKALKVKPSAVFDVVSIAPRAREERNQIYNNQAAAKNTHKVLATLHEIGLPASRISLTDAIDDVNASEVRIFVH
jgi:hypothetical protein